MPPPAVSTHAKQVEETLDPADWEQFRRFAHRVIDDTVEWLAALRERTAWKEMPAAVRDSFGEASRSKGLERSLLMRSLWSGCGPIRMGICILGFGDGYRGPERRWR